MNNNELDEALNKAYIECVQHLDTITCTDVGVFNFTFDGEHTYTCMRQLVEPLKVKFHDFAIEDFFIIFEVTGKISTSKPIYHGQHSSVNTCTFWVESLPNQVLCVLWCQIPGALHAITACVAFPTNISHVYGEDPATGKVSLLIQWASKIKQQHKLDIQGLGRGSKETVWEMLAHSYSAAMSVGGEGPRWPEEERLVMIINHQVPLPVIESLCICVTGGITLIVQ